MTNIEFYSLKIFVFYIKCNFSIKVHGLIYITILLFVLSIIVLEHSEHNIIIIHNFHTFVQYCVIEPVNKEQMRTSYPSVELNYAVSRTTSITNSSYYTLISYIRTGKNSPSAALIEILPAISHVFK